MYRAFRNETAYISPMVATIPALFAKASLAWPALLSLFGNMEIRRKILFNSKSTTNSLV